MNGGGERDDSDEGYDARMAARYDEDFVATFGGPDRGDLSFFRRMATASVGPIVEVGAGTGRVLRALAALGLGRPIVGVEPSAAMRARFEARPETGATMVAGSFQALPLGAGSAGLVFAAFRSFQHLLTVEDQWAALTEMRRVLAPGGILALDFFDPPYDLLSYSRAKCGLRYRTERGTRVERWETRRVLRVAQVIAVEYRWVERRGQRVVADERGTYRVRYTFPFELRHLLARAGFGDARVDGDYDGNPVGEVPRDLVVTARVGRVD